MDRLMGMRSDAGGNDYLSGDIINQTRRYDGWRADAITHNPCEGILIHCAER